MGGRDAAIKALSQAFPIGRVASAAEIANLSISNCVYSNGYSGPSLKPTVCCDFTNGSEGLENKKELLTAS
jgi:hypothetical protein